MRVARSLVIGVVLLAVVAVLVVPVFGRVIDNSRPLGFSRSPGLFGRAQFEVRVVEAGASWNIIWVDPIHICGSGRGG